MRAGGQWRPPLPSAPRSAATPTTTLEGERKRLELLLAQYQDTFGEAFPLAAFEGVQESEVINVLYDCVYNNLPYDPNRKAEYRIMDAPGMKK
jgi:hypothetical protein